MDTEAKNLKIKEALKDTKERHAAMFCRVFEVKVDYSKLSREKKAHFDALFREAKWVRNAAVGSADPFKFNRDAEGVFVKMGQVYVYRKIEYLGSQMRQDMVDSVKGDIVKLSKKKAKGETVGRLKFKSFWNSIPLRQYGNTFRINFENNTITIQNLRKPIKVVGLKQITPDMEIANAELLRKASGYYFHITTYSKPVAREGGGGSVGLDFGIKTTLTFSNEETRNIKVLESKGTKLASKRVNKSLKRKGGKKGKNHQKRSKNLRAAYEKTTNKKQDLANKAVHDLLEHYDFIGMQDELIKNWHKGLFGRQVQHSAMGSIKGKLKKSSKVQVVPASFPSTQRCPVCGKDTKHPLEKRDYDCAYCGYHHWSRDVKSAQMNLIEANRLRYGEHISQSLVEARASAGCCLFADSPGKPPPVKQEAHQLKPKCFSLG